MKKNSLLSVVGFFLLSVALPACTAQDQGPVVWLDRPLDGDHVQTGPVILQAHASDSDGVAAIEFYNGEELIAKVPTDGQRLGEAELEWAPPKPGSYTISVRAVDSKGQVSSRVDTRLVFGESAPVEVPVTPPLTLKDEVRVVKVECGPGFKVAVDFIVTSSTGVVSVEIFSTYVATQESKITYSSPYPMLVQDRLWLDEDRADDVDRPHQVGVKAVMVGSSQPVFGYGYEPGDAKRCPGHYAGAPAVVTKPVWLVWIARLNTNCRAGPGTAYNVLTAIMAGQQVEVTGKNSDESWFQVQPPGDAKLCWVSSGTGQIEGDLGLVPVVSPPPLPVQVPTLTLTTMPPADTTPPGISAASVVPDQVLKEGPGCPSYPRNTTVSAQVVDAGGVSRVIARIPGYGEVNMNPAGGNLYQAQLGPFAETGTLSILIVASDNAGNTASAGPLALNILACLE